MCKFIRCICAEEIKPVWVRQQTELHLKWTVAARKEQKKLTETLQKLSTKTEGHNRTCFLNNSGSRRRDCWNCQITKIASKSIYNWLWASQTLPQKCYCCTAASLSALWSMSCWFLISKHAHFPWLMLLIGICCDWNNISLFNRLL